MTKDELEASDRSKYGDKSNDLISNMFKRNFSFGVCWCAGNAERYLLRFNREGSSKQGNKIDIEKAKNYIGRILEKIDLSKVNHSYNDFTSDRLAKEALEYLNEMYKENPNLQLLHRVQSILSEMLERDELFKVNKDIIEE